MQALVKLKTGGGVQKMPKHSTAVSSTEAGGYHPSDWGEWGPKKMIVSENPNYKNFYTDARSAARVMFERVNTAGGELPRLQVGQALKAVECPGVGEEGEAVRGRQKEVPLFCFSS